MISFLDYRCGSGPLPRPATHGSILEVAGRGSGPVLQLHQDSARRRDVGDVIPSDLVDDVQAESVGVLGVA